MPDVEICKDCNHPFTKSIIKIDENEEITISQCGCRENVNYFYDENGSLQAVKLAKISLNP